MNTDNSKKIVFVLPPPNVTGSLHIGHALNIAMQDIQARRYQDNGYEVNWIPGTDHAGIATQLVAERKLTEEGKNRDDFSREEFEKYIWEVKEEHESVIQGQFKKMNTIINWDAYCFTLNPNIHKAVMQAFIQLHKKGLIYRDNRLTYWDPVLQTAYSDLEVDFRELPGKFVYVKYELVDCKTDDGEDFIVSATTRPETILADTALALHPDNPKYKSLIGKEAIVPFTNRKIKIIGDERCDLEKGTGVLKVTPAYDWLDYDIGQDHDLEMIQIIDKRGFMFNVPEPFAGLSVKDAKQKIIEELDKHGKLIKVEEIKHNVPIGEKSGNVLEILPTEQWFVDAKPLADKALKAVADGRIDFFSANFINIYNRWLENIQPWCISRQIIWGHRLPVWYVMKGKKVDRDSFVIVEHYDEALKQAKKKFGNDVSDIVQEEDVLDTWFSSALWPFAPLGYPEKEIDLPTSFLVTGKDILFFWIARMIMMSLELCDEVPFKQVCLHGLVLDGKGKKMSKMVGNVINPLEMIEKYSADILKIALVSKASPGKDVKFNDQAMVLARNFLTKIENGAGFCKLKGACEVSDLQILPTEPWCQWILQELNCLIDQVYKLFDSWEVAQALNNIQVFFWDKFCAWFLESVKVLESQNGKVTDEIKGTLRHVMQCILRLLHPYCPDFTESLFGELFGAWRVQKWSSMKSIGQWNESGIAKIKQTQEAINYCRSISKMSAFSDSILIASDIVLDDEFISKITKLEVKNGECGKCLRYATAKMTFGLKLKSDIELDEIKRRMQKQIEGYEKILNQAQNRLVDDAFITNASAELIAEMQARIIEHDRLIKEQSTLLNSLEEKDLDV